MDCNQAEELFVPYLLGALDSEEERSFMDAHISNCAACSIKLQGDGEVVARLAAAVPQVEAPSQVKQRLLARIDSDISSQLRAVQSGSLLVSFWAALNRNTIAHAGKAAASVLIVGLVFGGIWFNNRLNELSSENQELSGQLEDAIEREVGMIDMVRDQRSFTYEALRMTAMSGTSVNMLWATRPSPRAPSARGMMMVSHSEPRALLLVLDLPPLPHDKVYQVWLIRGDQRYSAGLFTVDSTGSGQAIIIPVAPLANFDAIEITSEPEGGSSDPTGANVLAGDL